MANVKGARRGRKGISPAKWNEVVIAITVDGKTPAEAAQECGICVSKAYEINRHPVLKHVPSA